MKLCVDEDLASKELMARLEKAGHLAFALDAGTSDDETWAAAQHQQAAVLTRNAVDYVRKAQITPEHHGLLLVYAENDRSRDMRIPEIAAAVGKIDALYPEGITGLSLALNGFR